MIPHGQHETARLFDTTDHKGRYGMSYWIIVTLGLGDYLAMAWSVNIDLESMNDPHSEPMCRQHRDAGPHYDVTIHPPACRHHGRPRAMRLMRYWRDFDTEDEAKQFAKRIAADPADFKDNAVSVADPILVRVCHG